MDSVCQSRYQVMTQATCESRAGSGVRTLGLRTEPSSSGPYLWPRAAHQPQLQGMHMCRQQVKPEVACALQLKMRTWRRTPLLCRSL